MGISAYFVFNRAVEGGGAVLVPDVTGLTIIRAVNVLSEAGLELGTQTTIMNDRVPEYHVIVQRPSANRVVRAGRKVSLKISAEREYKNAPNLIGKDLKEALQQLEETRLRPGSVARLSSDAPADTVLGQDPEAHAPISTGSEIHLLVSDGPKAKPIFMPDILGKSMEEAQLILAGLDVEVVPYKVDRVGEEHEVVLAQAPEPGTLLRAGEDVVSFDVRLLPSSFLPNARLLREVIYTVPQRPGPVLVQVKLVDQQGKSTDLYPGPDDYVDGRPPRLPPGYTIRVPAIVYNETTVEFYVEGALHTSYYFVGDADPLVTVNELRAAAGEEGLVEQQELEKPRPKRRGLFGRGRNRGGGRNYPQ